MCLLNDGNLLGLYVVTGWFSFLISFFFASWVEHSRGNLFFVISLLVRKLWVESSWDWIFWFFS